eukprot:CAMPEP_0118648440 /NCGR_PEP_ID=MMETSP0785-20121206/9158_1 /TAXON_ID=91992 /ORGANISM="Bolidomonas pacifica, Strain CCMP 1866" /LENGTH=56 /DNA_ID=CAMNT_0006540635 /DNA_START=306 /DNA_END=476 /DNA_ORIENTATION=-
MKEGVLCLVVSGANGLLEADHVDYVAGSGDVKNLHATVVHGVVGGEEVEVAGYKDK